MGRTRRRSRLSRHLQAGKLLDAPAVILIHADLLVSLDRRVHGRHLFVREIDGDPVCIGNAWEVMLYFTADLKTLASSIPSSVPIFSARFTRSTWSMPEDLANSLVLALASDTALYSLSWISLLADRENAAKGLGAVVSNSAKSTRDKVVELPWPFWVHTRTKSSAICFPISRVDMEVSWASFVSQSV